MATTLIKFTNLFFKKAYNNGDNNGKLIVVCKDNEIKCHLDILRITTNFIDTGIGKFIDPESICKNKSICKNECGKDCTNKDNKKKKLDFSKYSSVVVNAVLNKCYSPDVPFDSILSLENIIQMLELFEFIQYKFEYVEELAKLYVDKVTTDNCVDAIELLYKYPVASNVKIKPQNMFTNNNDVVFLTDTVNSIVKNVIKDIGSDYNKINNIVTSIQNTTNSSKAYVLTLFIFFKK